MLIPRYLRYRGRGVLLGFVVILSLPTVIIITTRSIRPRVPFGNTRDSLLSMFPTFKDTKGSKANYSFPSVASLVDVYLSKQQTFGLQFALRDSQSYTEFVKGLRSGFKHGTLHHLQFTNQTIPGNISGRGMSSWQRFYQEITEYELYDPYKSDMVTDLLNDLSKRSIVSAEHMKVYVQTTLALKLDNGAYGVFKPRRFPIEYETLSDLLYFSEFPRHHSEVTAFHLDRVLGFHRAPPTVGRKFNVTQDFKSGGGVTVYVSPGGNNCIMTFCQLVNNGCCGSCGNPDILEGSLTIYLRGSHVLSSVENKTHPWSRSYNMTKTAWELDDDYCQSQVKVHSRFKHGRTLLDLIDLAVFDFLMGNMDRSNYERFKEFGDDSFVFHIDNSKGFGKANYDCMSCLAPLRQCCQIRLSTLAKLIKLYQGPDSLSQLMRTSLNSDPLSPVLLEPHLDALDRRLGKVIVAVSECIHMGRSWEEVVINDGIK